MSDNIAALSAIMTVIAILYGLWYGDISRCSNIKLPLHRPDREPFIVEIKRTRNLKAIPLLCVNSGMGIIFTPAVIEILGSSVRLLLINQVAWTYNPPCAAFIFIVCISILLDVSLIVDIRKMNRKCR